jgi:hypothetical protein
MKAWILKEAKGLKFYLSFKANKDFDEDDGHDEVKKDYNENDEKRQCIIIKTKYPSNSNSLYKWCFWILQSFESI